MEEFSVLSFPISSLGNLSFTTGEFSTLCKIAKIIPLFQRGDPLDCSSYKPVSLLSTFSEIFEKCVCKRFYSFPKKNNLNFMGQFSFKSRYSSNLIIINLIESIKKYIDNDNYVHSVDSKQILHAFLFNIRNYLPEVINIQRREAEMNIILPRVNNFDIKQKKAWNICFIICHQHQTRSGKIKTNKTQQISVKTQVFFVKTERSHIFFLKSLTHEKINRI